MPERKQIAPAQPTKPRGDRVRLAGNRTKRKASGPRPEGGRKTRATKAKPKAKKRAKAKDERRKSLGALGAGRRVRAGAEKTRATKPSQGGRAEQQNHRTAEDASDKTIARATDPSDKGKSKGKTKGIKIVAGRKTRMTKPSRGQKTAATKEKPKAKANAKTSGKRES